MKYSIYVKNYLKREILRKNNKLSEAEAAREANALFKEILLDSEYEVCLNKLDNDDILKKLELEKEERFLDINPLDSVCYTNIENRFAFLYHGVRFDDNHETFEKILKEQSIKCAKLSGLYWKISSDNCNEGEHVSLIHYTGHKFDIEWKTFIEENIAFIISPKLNPLKCKYLPYEEWSEIKNKLPQTKHRYSYARGEYQYPQEIPFRFVVGILYPFRYYSHIKGYMKTREDFKLIQSLLFSYGLTCIPILDPTNDFEDITNYNYGNPSFRYR